MSQVASGPEFLGSAIFAVALLPFTWACEDGRAAAKEPTSMASTTPATSSTLSCAERGLTPAGEPGVCINGIVEPWPIDLCFSEETLVATPTGSVPIAEVEPGDWVLSYNHATEQVEPGRVLRRIENPHPVLLELSLDEGTTLRVTAEHPLYDSASDAYVPAGKLGPTDELLRLHDSDRGELRTTRLTALSPMPAVSGRRAYDLTVEGNHNFFAGGVLAHNKSPPLYPQPTFDTDRVAPTCDLGPLEVRACHELGVWAATQRPEVGAPSFVAYSVAIGEANETPGGLSSFGAALESDVLDAGAGLSDAGRDGGGLSSGDDFTSGEIPSDTGTDDAGSATAPNPLDAQSADAASTHLLTSALGVTNGMGDAGVVHGINDGGALDAAIADAMAEDANAAIPETSATSPSDGGAAVLVGSGTTTDTETHALWLEFARCPYLGSTVPYAAEIVLGGAPGVYSIGAVPSNGLCSLTQTEAEALTVDQTGSATTWVTLPENGVPFWLVVHGPAAFEVSMDLY